MEEKEALEEEKADRDAKAKQQTAKLAAANLAVVETIFDDMFKEDTEMAKLKYHRHRPRASFDRYSSWLHPLLM